MDLYVKSIFYQWLPAWFTLFSNNVNIKYYPRILENGWVSSRMLASERLDFSLWHKTTKPTKLLKQKCTAPNVMLYLWIEYQCFFHEYISLIPQRSFACTCAIVTSWIWNESSGIPHELDMINGCKKSSNNSIRNFFPFVV